MSKYKVPDMHVIFFRGFVALIFVEALLYMTLGWTEWLALGLPSILIWMGSEVIYAAYRVDRESKRLLD